MAIEGDGAGTTIAIAGSSWTTAQIVDVNFDPISRPVLDTTELSDTTYRTSIPGSAKTPGGFTVTLHHDQAASAIPPITEASASIQINVPSTGTIIGTGFCDEWTPPNIENGVIMDNTAHFTYDGETPPAFST